MRGGREISLCAGRRICRSKCGRKSRPASFEMTVRGQVGMRKKKSACSDRNDGLARRARRRGRCQKGVTALLPVSADKRIDLVSDPIIFENNGKERSYHPKSPALASQGVANRQALHGNVQKVGGAEANVGQHGKEGQSQNRRQC